jgi:hypothetical protein
VGEHVSFVLWLLAHIKGVELIDVGAYLLIFWDWFILFNLGGDWFFVRSSTINGIDSFFYLFGIEFLFVRVLLVVSRVVGVYSVTGIVGFAVVVIWFCLYFSVLRVFPVFYAYFPYKSFIYFARIIHLFLHKYKIKVKTG